MVTLDQFRTRPLLAASPYGSIALFWSLERDFWSSPGSGHGHSRSAFQKSAKGGHWGTPAIRQACSNLSTSWSRRNGVALIAEIRKAVSVRRIASQARRASAMRPAIARLAIDIRCAPGKFGWRWMAFSAQDRPSSYRPAKKWAKAIPVWGHERTLTEQRIVPPGSNPFVGLPGVKRTCWSSLLTLTHR